MARNKAFDTDQALDAAIGVFRQHGFEGTSAEMLVRAMGIGRQSLYDTFGDKWQLYLAAVARYSDAERVKHVGALRSGARAIDGIRTMVDRVVAEAHQACLGVGSICEFGQAKPDLSQLHRKNGMALRAALIATISQSQGEGDLSAELNPEDVADFIISTYTGIRVAARGGAGDETLRSLGAIALRALN